MEANSYWRQFGGNWREVEGNGGKVEGGPEEKCDLSSAQRAATTPLHPPLNFLHLI